MAHLKTQIALFLLGIVLAECLTMQYANRTRLSPEYEVQWTVDNEDIHLALIVNTTGWIGFGIAEFTSGSMPGADILTGYVLSDGRAEIQDRHTLVKAFPVEDDCQSWTLRSGQEVSGVTTLEVSRKLNTGDTQDRAIVSGLNRIIYAYGRTDTVGYHENNRKATTLTFFGYQPVDNSHLAPGVQHVDFLMNNATIAPIKTHYVCQAYPISLPVDAHIIRIEAIINPATRDRVHHFVVAACNDPTNEWIQNRTNNPGECDTPCFEYIWAWAPGMGPMIFPPEAGFRIGPNSTFGAIIMQIHYDNPQLVSNIVDNSGIRIYYTTTLRRYDAGLLELGDPLVSAKNIPALTAETTYEFNCPESCSSSFPSELIVFADFLHMHEIGKSMVARHFRGTQYLGEINRIDFWDFAFQQVTPVSFTIRPGDRLHVHCVYDSRTRTAATKFDLGSEDEMCIEFLFYYPRMPNHPRCGGFRPDPRIDNTSTICGNDFHMDWPNPTVLDTMPFETTFGTPFTGMCTRIDPPTTSTGAGDTESTAVSIKSAVYPLVAICMYLLINL